VQRRERDLAVGDVGAEFAQLLRDSARATDGMPLLGMGRDVPDGRLHLDDRQRLALDWSIERSRPYFERVRATARKLAEELGGKLMDDPLWYLSSVVTVHPLGGCPMGRSAADGVVDAFGRVFDSPDLLICDGSVMPGPVGPNPSLTIAAVAERTASQLIADL